MSHGFFCRQGEGGPVTIEGVIVVIFGSWCCVNHGPSTVDASLDFRGSANKRPSKRGADRGATNFRQVTQSIVCPPTHYVKMTRSPYWSVTLFGVHKTTRQEWGLRCNRGEQQNSTIGIKLPSGTEFQTSSLTLNLIVFLRGMHLLKATTTDRSAAPK